MIGAPGWSAGTWRCWASRCCADRPCGNTAGARTAAARRRDAAQGDTWARRARHAVIDPLLRLFGASVAVLILGFVALFKLGEAMGGIMTAPFYRTSAFDATRSPGPGRFRWSPRWPGSLWAAGWWHGSGSGGRCCGPARRKPLAMAMYVVLAHGPASVPVLYLTVATEAFAQGMADAAFLTYLSGLCSRAFTATHYALLSSIPALAIHTIGGVSGLLAGAVGWVAFYAVCTFAALPAPLVVSTIFQTIRQLREAGLAILLVEQNARVALTTADRAYVLSNGRIVTSGTAAELSADHQVQESYLGGIEQNAEVPQAR